MEEDFSLAMDQRRAEALAAIQAERAQTEQWVQRTRAEAARQARAEIAAAEETARRLVAEAQARVEELADVRSRIAAQLRGTQSQLSTAIDSLAPEALPPALPAPAVAAAPPAPVVNAAPPAPAVNAAPAPPAVEAAPTAPAVESAPQPPHCPPPRTPRRRPQRAPTTRSSRSRSPCPPPSRTPAAPDTVVLDVPEQADPAAGEARARRSAGASARTAPRVADDGRAAQRRPPGLRCSRCAQHALCQCRRSATDPCSPAGHVTRCPVPAVMSWSQPGQR